MTNAGFRYYDLRIGEAITLTGQVSDMHAANSVNAYLNKVLKTGDVDYILAGDSVVGETLIEINGEKMTIASYYDRYNTTIYADEYNKSYVKPVNNDITNTVNINSGEIEQKPVLHVMKHRVKKEMFKVTVNDMSVIVTEDHSIIVKRHNRLMSVKPKDICESDEIITIQP